MAPVRAAVLSADGADLSDGQLLGRFVEWRDEAAFEALLRRHGPMVLGVCRRVLRDTHDAEDAFQAVFIVLARKAAVVAPREAVAGWLYGVARRTAFKARALAARRRTHEVPRAQLPEPEAADPGQGRRTTAGC
jgi:RNA polymerase sigma factor (sigma-70 family)